jgi:O-antigen/teichoic acid export membrane protein
LFGVFLNIGLNALLIPIWGAYGAAFTCLLTQGIMGFVQLILCIKRFGYSVFELGIMRYLFFSTYLLLLTLIPVSETASLIILASGGFVGLFLFKLIDLKTMVEIYNVQK